MSEKGSIGETVVGAAVLAVAVGFLAFAVARGGAAAASGGVPISARFSRIDGIKPGADVRLSGVKIGSVSAVSVDGETYLAKVSMSLDPAVSIPDDSVARIASDGLLGGAYVTIEPGGSPDKLAAGAEIADTQGSIDLITLFSGMMKGGGGSSSQGPTP